MTIVYLMRHSRGKMGRIDINVCESFQNTNEKYILSVEGEKRALEYSKLKELQNLSCVVSSNYVRTMSTAKYMAEKNKLPIEIDENFNERKFGVDSRSKLPQNFFKHQYEDHDFKLEGGESFNETKKRMLKGLARIIKNNKDKKSLIVSHGSSIVFMLSKWCTVDYENNYKIKFKGKTVINSFDSPELLELKFDDNNKLVNIRRVRCKNLKYNTK